MYTLPRLADILPALPARSAVMIRGNHGIGKSSIVRQAAKKIREKEGLESFPVIDRRLSQMTAGDIIGLPKLEDGTTKFFPPDWYMMACRQPCALFLDELNRAEPDVIAGAFQIVLDRELNGHQLHPQTRVYTAINTDAVYSVQPIDPALLDRFWVADILFRNEDWRIWAVENKIDPLVIDFIDDFPGMLIPPAGYDPTQVNPSPRSTTSGALTLAAELESLRTKGTWDKDLVLDIFKGYCGLEFAIAFVNHTLAPLNFSGEDIVEHYQTKKHLIKDRVDVLNVAIDKAVDYIDTLETINETQGENIKAFGYSLTRDGRVVFWQKVAKKGRARKGFIKEFSEYMKWPLVEGFGVKVGPEGVGMLPNIHGIAAAPKA